jgi:hypothetical protein
VIDASALRVVLAVLMAWLNRQEDGLLRYLIEENRLLRRQLRVGLGRNATRVEQERQGALLPQWEQDDGRGRVDEPGCQIVSTAPALRTAIRLPHGYNPQLRRQPRWSAILDGEGQIRVRPLEPGAELVRGAEAPRADEVALAHASRLADR